MFWRPKEQETIAYLKVNPPLFQNIKFQSSKRYDQDSLPTTFHFIGTGQI